MRTWKLFVSLVLAAVAAGGLWACGSSDSGDDSGLVVLVKPGTAFVVTTDYRGSGGYALVDLETLKAQTFQGNGIVESDNSVTYYGGKIYVINRKDFDNITVLDPSDVTRAERQFSTGNGTNPHSMAFVSSEKAYVSLYGADYLLIVNPSTGEEIGRIDLSGYADDDGIPEASPMVIVDGKLYVALQRLDRNNWFAPTGTSYVVVVDTGTDEVVAAIELTGTNPQFMRYDEAMGRIVVSETGNYGSQDGGLETIDPDTNRAEGFFLSEADLGGDVGAFAVVGGVKVYVVFTDASWQNHVSVWEQSEDSWQKKGVLETSGGYVPSLGLDGTDRLLVPDRDTENPGLRIFDTTTDQEVEGSPVDVGLPPNAVAVF